MSKDLLEHPERKETLVSLENLESLEKKAILVIRGTRVILARKVTLVTREFPVKKDRLV